LAVEPIKEKLWGAERSARRKTYLRGAQAQKKLMTAKNANSNQKRRVVTKEISAQKKEAVDKNVLAREGKNQ